MQRSELMSIKKQFEQLNVRSSVMNIIYCPICNSSAHCTRQISVVLALFVCHYDLYKIGGASLP